MALVEGKDAIVSAMNSKNEYGFMRVTKSTVTEFGQLIKKPEEEGMADQKARNIADPMAEIKALIVNLRNTDPEIRKKNGEYLLTLFARGAKASYSGEVVKIRLHQIDMKNDYEKQFVRFLCKSAGWEKDPKHVLEMLIDGKVVGVFIPNEGFFIPAARFRENTIDGMSIDKYLNLHPEIKERTRALITTLINNGGSKDILGHVVARIGGKMTDNELEIYQAEMYEPLPEDTKNYITTVSKVVSTEAVCCRTGLNTKKKLLDTVTFIHTGSGAKINTGMTKISQELVAIAPVFATSYISDVAWKMSELHQEEDVWVPTWIEFSARMDGVLYHKVYPEPESGWQIYAPENVIDLAAGVPDGILSKYNYLIQPGTSFATFNDNELKCTWNVFPADDMSQTMELCTTKKEDGNWKMLQRSLRIERMELQDFDGNVLGMIFADMPKPFASSIHKMIVSIDFAGSRMVRLVSVSGSGQSKELTYDALAEALTPISEEELKDILKKHSMFYSGKGFYRDSQYQKFFFKEKGSSGGHAAMEVDGVIWDPDQNALFTALKEYDGTMSSVMQLLGVFSSPKVMISHNLGQREEEECLNALKMLLGSLVYETTLALSREGYSIAAGNLEFLISYPETGNGEGITRKMKEAISGGIQFVNKSLTGENKLVEDKNNNPNVHLFSESEASAEWHKHNSPSRNWLGSSVASITKDGGISTDDNTVAANGCQYTFSIPYGAKRITIDTLAKVYAQDVDGLLQCYEGGKQDFICEVKSTMQKSVDAVESQKLMKGKPSERLAIVMSIQQLFNNCIFSLNGDMADYKQKLVQQLTEAKLNLAIPAYADAIVRAVNDGNLSFSSDVKIAPVGKGSLAINNTSSGFEDRWITRLYDEIEQILGSKYIGRIEMLPNNDTKKFSVAEGMIMLVTEGNKHKPATVVRIRESDLDEYYLKVVYGDDENKKQTYKDKLAKVDTKATELQKSNLRTGLYEQAFQTIVNSYTYEKFEMSFNRFAYTGTMGGVFDQKIRTFASENFENLKGELFENCESLIMCVPGVEEEMCCSAMVDCCIEHIDL